MHGGEPGPGTERAAWRSPGCTEEGPALVHGGGSSPGCWLLRAQPWGRRAVLDIRGGSLGCGYAGDSSTGVVVDVLTHLVR